MSPASKYRSLGALATFALVGCSGVIGGSDAERDDPLDPVPVQFTCDPSLDPSPTTLRRLSKTEYANTIRHLVGMFASGGTQDAIMGAIDQELDGIPSDAVAESSLEGVRGATFERLDSTLSQRHADAFFSVGRAFAEQALSSTDRRSALLGDCAVDGDPSNDSTCVENFIESFGLKTTRRPISPEEKAFFMDVYADEESPSVIDFDGFSDVIVVMLSSPNFVYHLEDRGTPVDGREDMYDIDAYELASRLSFHFWQSMPDDQLFAAAANGSLLDETGYRTEVDRIYADPRTETTLAGFFYEWFALSKTPEVHRPSDLAFNTFSGGMTNPELTGHMVVEVLELTRHYSKQPDGTLEDLFLSNVSFARTQDLADIYGVPAWDGSESFVTFPPGERAGVLTRAAMVAAGGVRTSPVQKGVRIRRNILCDGLPDPPPDAVLAEVDLPPPFTKRQEMEALTMQPESACIGCHTLINGLGFPTENFDSIGRVRTEEMVFEEDGSLLGTVDVETEAIPLVDPADNRPVNDGVEMSERVVESGKLQACFVRHYFRFAFSRVEDLARDGCALERLREAVVEGEPLGQVFKSIAMTPEFRLHKRGEL